MLGRSKARVEHRNDSIRTSDGIGILNARKSVEALRGELHMYQERTENGSVATMQIQVPFRRVRPSDRRITPSTPLLGNADCGVIPAPTMLISAITPSDMNKSTSQLGPPLHVETGPTTAVHHEPKPTTTGPGLKCFSLDDAPSLLKQYTRMLHRYLQASESLVAGTTRAEVEAAVDIAMGRTTPLLEPASVVVPADIVTLDYDLGHPRFVGTDIAARLHEEGFKGLVCILSGGSAEDLEAFLHMPGVDMVCGKEVRLKSLAPILLESHQNKISGEAGQQSL